jgi:2-dehydro-3-deoxyphosphogluconate aldolase/(4S)-4-hydroxy-2-oxoglutarate aldolase
MSANNDSVLVARVVAAVNATRVVAIIRGIDVDRIVPTARALAAGGVRALEVTFPGTGAEAVDSIAGTVATLVAGLPPEVAVGAGTVVTREQLRAAVQAGASFIVSPDTNPEIIEATRDAGLASLPGAMTATECLAAHRAGATFVKVFPAGRLGPGYIKDLRGPLSWISFMAVGAVDLDNARAFLDAGCVGLGIGGSLVRQDLVRAGRYDELTNLAARYLDITKES